MFEWSFVIAHQQDPILRRMTAILLSRKQIRQAMDRLPLTAAGDELLHGAAPWYREWISRRDLGDPLWKNANFTPALNQVKIPVLLQGGWQDGFLRQTVAAYARLADRGADVALTMGPPGPSEHVDRRGAARAARSGQMRVRPLDGLGQQDLPTLGASLGVCPWRMARASGVAACDD